MFTTSRPATLSASRFGLAVLIGLAFVAMSFSSAQASGKSGDDGSQKGCSTSHRDSGKQGKHGKRGKGHSIDRKGKGKGHKQHGNGHGHGHTEGSACAATKGRIVIEKQTYPHGSAQAFAFVAASLDADGFTLKDDESVTFDNLTPGTFAVSETAFAGWQLHKIYCHDASSNTTVNASTATINVAAGETVHCVFKNKQTPPVEGKGRIVIEKQTDPHGSTQAFAFVAAGLDADGFTLKDDESVIFDNLTPGSFAVSESATAGWALKRIHCQAAGTRSGKDEDRSKKGEDGPWMAHKSGGDLGTDGHHSGGADVNVSGNAVTINVAAGQTVSCVFKNRQLPPAEGTGRIVIAKVTSPRGDPAAFAFAAATLDADGFTLADGEAATFNDVTPGTYTVSETVLAGWSLQSLTCADASSDTTIAAATATIKVAAGETVTCTFTNLRASTLTPAPTGTGTGAAPVSAPAPTSTTPPASGVLQETASSIRSSASLQAPSRCVRGSYSVRVNGRAVSRVAFYVNGKLIRTIRARSGQTTFSSRVNVRAGRIQRLQARVSFKSNASPRSRTLRATLIRCQAVRGVLPQFTG